MLDDDSITIADAIAAWVAAGDEARRDGLLEVLNHCADITVQVLADGDAEAAEALATTFIPLRAALVSWPPAAELPPYNTFLGCLQALLRRDEAQLVRLFAGLDDHLARALEQIGDLVAAARAETGTASQSGDRGPVEEVAAAGEPVLSEAIAGALDRGDLQAVERELAALGEPERERMLEALRRRSEQQVARMPPEQQRALARRLQAEQIARTADEIAGVAAQTLREGDGNAVRALAIQVAQAASHYGQGEERGSPYDELAAFLRGVAALLRGTPVPPVPEAYTARLATLVQEQGSREG
jgi:ketosteroid isomerase-like protein